MPHEHFCSSSTFDSSRLMTSQRDVTFNIDDVTNDGKYIIVTTRATIDVSRPGQCVELHHGDVSQYAVVSNWPCTNKQRFIIKAHSRLGESIVDGSAGTRLMSRAFIGGYDVSGIDERPVYFFAGGSGIAAIHALVDFVNDTCAVQTQVQTQAQKHQRHVFYTESDGQFIDVESHDINIHRLTTSGAVSSNEHVPILGMFAKLSGVNVASTFPLRPIVYACGPSMFVDRLRAAFAGLTSSEDFRTNY